MTEDSITRWSKPFDPKIHMAKLMGWEHWPWHERRFDYLSKAVEYLLPFTQDVEEAAQAMKESNFDLGTCNSFMEPFYLGEFRYMDPFDGHFNDTGLDQIYEVLIKSTQLGYDVREYWRKFRDVTPRLWKALPDFCKGERVVIEARDQKIRGISIYDYSKQYERLEIPSDYDPNKPFPQYPIPPDID